MILESQKNFFSQATAVFLVGSFAVYAAMLGGYLEPLLRVLVLLLGGAGYVVPMLTALAFIIMFSHSKPGTRFLVVVVFAMFAVATAVILGAWNIYSQAGAIPTTSGYGYFGYSYSINSAEVVNSAGHVGKAVLDYLIGESLNLRPTWSVEVHMLAIIATMIGSMVIGVVSLSYFVYPPHASHGRGAGRGRGRGHTHVHHYY